MIKLQICLNNEVAGSVCNNRCSACHVHLSENVKIVFWLVFDFSQPTVLSGPGDTIGVPGEHCGQYMHYFYVKTIYGRPI